MMRSSVLLEIKTYRGLRKQAMILWRIVRVNGRFYIWWLFFGLIVPVRGCDFSKVEDLIPWLKIGMDGRLLISWERMCTSTSTSDGLGWNFSYQIYGVNYRHEHPEWPFDT